MKCCRCFSFHILCAQTSVQHFRNVNWFESKLLVSAQAPKIPIIIYIYIEPDSTWSCYEDPKHDAFPERKRSKVRTTYYNNNYTQKKNSEPTKRSSTVWMNKADPSAWWNFIENLSSKFQDRKVFFCYCCCCSYFHIPFVMVFSSAAGFVLWFRGNAVSEHMWIHIAKLLIWLIFFPHIQPYYVKSVERDRERGGGR